MHPRQINHKKDILEFLKSKRIEACVEIDLASKLPLPILIKNCCLHVSNYSGTIIEAHLLARFSVILHQIGKFNFDNIIKLNHAVYIDSKEINLEMILKYYDLIINEIKSEKRKDYTELFKNKS